MLSPEDAKLLQGLLSKDAKSLRAFYVKQKEPLLAYIQRSLAPEDAEEVLQDSFIAFLEALRSFREQSSLKTFLFSIAKRKVVDHLRRKKVKKILFSYLPDYVVESLATVFLNDNIDKNFLARKIEKAFSSLPHDYALVLRLKYHEGNKVEEIAAKTHMSFKAVESLLFRARKAFIASFKQYERQNLFEFEESLRPDL